MKATDMIHGNKKAVRNISGLYKSRMKRGMMQKKLSQLTGIPTAEIRRYEFHKYLPRVKNYNKLAKVFGWEQIPVTQSEAPNPKHSYKKQEELPPIESVKLSAIVKFTFEEGHSYQILMTNKQEKEPIGDCVFRYEGKHGIHHIFREVRGNWTRTYTDSQLIGKGISEVIE